MIIGIAMQHPSGAALAPLDPSGEHKSTMDPAMSPKESNVQTPALYHINAPVVSSDLRPDVMSRVSAPGHVYISDSNTSQHQQQLHQQEIMVQLEAQFAQYGIYETNVHGEQFDSSGHNSNSDTVNNEDVEGQEADEEPVKLFVGQVPKTMNEVDIFPTFDSFGPLKDVSVIRDKHTGMHRGCAFVTYWSTADAERARDALHDNFTFPGAKRAAQVKMAEPSSIPENKLFIGMLSRKAGEQEVRDIFSQFGEVQEIHMIRNSDGSSKCAAFLKYSNRESAIQAIELLNGKNVMEGAARPLIVKFADNKHQRQLRHIRNVRRQEMMTMVGPPYPYPPMQSGIPMMTGHPVSAPPQYIAHYATGAYMPQPQQQPHTLHPQNPYMYGHPYGPPPPPYAYPSRPDTRSTNSRPREGPSGANLFVYHLPHDLTDADLATAFNPFGSVISAKVYVDKYTGESKGFGFVSYEAVVSAEAAIEQMNGFQIGNKRLKVQHKRIHGSHFDTQEPQSHPASLSGDSQTSPANG